jgi:anti-sigma factor (TIGR02949 family)
MTPADLPTLDCEEVVREIWDWLDHELDQARWAAIEAHLAGCTGCSEHVAFARGFLHRVHASPAPTNDAALKARIRSALAAVREA